MPRHPPCALSSLTFPIVTVQRLLEGLSAAVDEIDRAHAQGVALGVLKKRHVSPPPGDGRWDRDHSHADYSDIKVRGAGGAVPAAGRCPGGDGRARTGDPLLAKQVLSQLSYIPMRGAGRAGSERGPFWIRTRDLTVISRALLPAELKARGAQNGPHRDRPPAPWRPGGGAGRTRVLDP